jgi:CubicO group peptidase (beta-lactamase class C family)
MTTRDFARFGLLSLRGGSWDGEQIVPTEWVDESRVPATTNPGYGLQWRLGPNGRMFQAEGLFATGT